MTEDEQCALAFIKRMKDYVDSDYEFTLEEKKQLVLIASRARERGKAAIAGLTIYKVFVGASLDRTAETDRTVAELLAPRGN